MQRLFSSFYYFKSLSVYFIFLLLIPFLPTLNSIDPIGAQWLYLALINFVFIFFIKNVNIKSFSLPFKIYLLFFLFSLFSLFYSNNISLSIIDLSRILLIIVSVIIITSLYTSKKKGINTTILYYLFILFFFAELIYSLWPYFYSVFLRLFTDYTLTITTTELLGIAGNKNITAASIVIKLPFVFYFLLKKKSYIISSLILYLVFTSLFLLISRASYISMFFIMMLYSILMMVNKSGKSLFVTYFSILVAYLTIVFYPANINNFLNQVKTISFTQESSNWRFELWSNVLDYLSNNPLKGVGIGNWKIESLPYWKYNLDGYLVPYHAHNDFLQYSVELGIIGGLVFLSFFILSFIFLIKRINFKMFLNQKNLIYFTFLLVLFSLLVDTSLNFPHERFLIQFNTILFLIFTNIISFNESKID